MVILLIPTCCILATILIQGSYSCNSSIENSVRLNNEGVFESTVTAGRVEICRCSNSTSCYWETVSTGSLTDPFSWKNSIVVCRELDFFDVQSPILQSTVLDANHADDSVPIYGTTFDCDGTENSLIDCSPGQGTGSQTHKSDAYITCQTSPTHLKVRMVGGSTDPTQGIIEIYLTSSGWSTVCSDFWRDIEADIFCKSLGFYDGVANSYPHDNFMNTAVDSDSSVNIVCSSSDVFISGCSVNLRPDCAAFNVLAGARCTSSNAGNGDVRLYNVGSTTFSRVEVFFAGRWGTVCNSAWVIEAGEVACRELGKTPSLTQIPSTLTATSTYESYNNTYGHNLYNLSGYSSFNSFSSRPIWIFGYSCDGDESSLNSCDRPSFPIGFPGSTCSHSKDASLYCETAPYKLSGGGIAGIVIAGLVVAGVFVGAIVLHDKHKKGELQPWYRQRRARFLTWYQQRRRQLQVFQRTYCSCCSHRRRRTNRQPQSSENNATEPGVISNPTHVTPAPTPQQQQTPPSQPPVAVPPSQPPTEFTPTAPPSYDVAINHQHVPPPPDYLNDAKLPYPETNDYHPAYPPPGSAGTH